MHPIIKRLLLLIGIYYLNFRGYKLAFLRWLYSFAYILDLVRKPYKVKIQINNIENYYNLTGLWYWDTNNWKEMPNITCFTTSLWRQPSFLTSVRKALLNHHFYSEEMPQTRTYYALRFSDKKDYIVHLRITGHVDYEEASIPKPPPRCVYTEPMFDTINIIIKSTPRLTAQTQARKTGNGKNDRAGQLMDSELSTAPDTESEISSSSEEEKEEKPAINPISIDKTEDDLLAQLANMRPNVASSL